MLSLSFKNSVLEAKSSEVFTQVLSYNELKEAGMRFKQPQQSKDETKGCFVIAELPNKQVISIPCGKSVDTTTNIKDCSFGVTKDDTLLAFVGNSNWVD